MECWGKDRHKESIVDIAHQLVSDIRVGHLGTAHISPESSEVEGCSYFITCEYIFHVVQSPCMQHFHVSYMHVHLCFYLNNSVTEFQ